MIDKRQLAPASKRNNTDLPCLVLFLCFTLSMLILGLYCYCKGSLDKFSLPFDPDGKGCGTDHPQHPYIYFPAPQTDSIWRTTCLKECPSKSNQTVDCAPNSAVPSCQEINSPDNNKAFQIYPTYIYRGSVCLPQEQAIKEKVLAGVGARTIQELFGSVVKDWSLFLLMAPICLVSALLMLLLIRVVASYVVYMLYGIAVGVFVGFGAYLLVPDSSSSFFLKHSYPLALVAAFLCFGLATVMLLLFFSHYQRIKTAVQFLDNANIFLGETWGLIFLPLILTVLFVLFLLFWIFLTLSFYSMGEPLHQQRQLPFQHYKLTFPVISLLIINIFYLIWGSLFLMHSGSHIVAGALVNWQFSRERPHLLAAKNLITTHTGSVALGSFLTAFLGVFKFELDQADCTQRQRENEPDNGCIDCLKRCYGCFCCCCIAVLFRCFHKAAYIYQNLTGLPYCQCSTEVNEVLLSQKEHWAPIASLHLIFDQLLPLISAIGHVLIANALVNHIELYKDNTSNRLLLLLAIALLGYTVAQFFICLYGESIQGLFIVQAFHLQTLSDREEYELRIPPRKKEEFNWVRHTLLPQQRNQRRREQLSGVTKWKDYTSRMNRKELEQRNSRGQSS